MTVKKQKKQIRLSLICFGLFWASSAFAQPLVLAAASTREAISEAVSQFKAQSGLTLNLSLAASSTLARQIASGAPAGVFLSANQRWMDDLDRKGFLQKGSKINYLSNRLVLIAPRSLQAPAGLSVQQYLQKYPGRLAIGNPQHVPAGLYAKESLKKLGLWSEVQSRLAPASNVRLALVLVETGECPLGVVYQTDALATPKVQVLVHLPSPRPVVYTLALVVGGGKTSQAFYQFLRSPAGLKNFLRHGFSKY